MTGRYLAKADSNNFSKKDTTLELLPSKDNEWFHDEWFHCDLLDLEIKVLKDFKCPISTKRKD